MLTKLIKYYLYLVFILAGHNLWGKGTGGVPGSYLHFPINTISLSVSTPDEINASYLNPAGLFMVDRNDFTFLYSTLYEGVTFSYLCYCYPVRLLGTFAISRVGINMGDLEGRDPFATFTQNFSSGKSTYLITYAHKILPKVIIGTNFKITNENLYDYTTYNIGNDVGLQIIPFKNVYVGFNIQNLVRPKMKLKEDTDIWPTNVNRG